MHLDQLRLHVPAIIAKGCDPFVEGADADLVAQRWLTELGCHRQGGHHLLRANHLARGGLKVPIVRRIERWLSPTYNVQLPGLLRIIVRNADMRYTLDLVVESGCVLLIFHE